jgi:integrase
LCLGTGQRIGDVLRMRWSDIEDGAIRVKQGKTGNELWIPLTPRLGRLLDASARRGFGIVVGEDGRPLSYRRAAYAVDAIHKQAGTRGLTIHGLRHSTAAELAEAGCTDAQIAAVTGHKSLRMVAKYRAGAAQKRLAKEAMGKRERNEDRT